jgi:hypothetical protein
MPVILHTILWAVLGCSLIFQSAPGLYRDVRFGKIGPIDPNRSIELYFRGLTGIANGPQHLGDILEFLPRQRPLLIFVRDDSAKSVNERNAISQSQFLGMLVAYICWPRDVRMVRVNGETLRPQVAAVTANSVAGMAFCGLAAPSGLGKPIHLGLGITLVPAIETQ